MFHWFVSGRGSSDGWLELRESTDRGMRCEFFPVRAGDALRRRAFSVTQKTDVYIGVVPRARRAGRGDDVASSWLLWADIDSADGVSALQRFEPRPSLVVGSGTPGHVHAYWALRQPLPRTGVESGNRRLVAALNADPACCDAARILRPPGTLNHKGASPSPVELLACSPGSIFDACEVLRRTPQLRTCGTDTRTSRASDDPLLAISPRRYVPTLVGARLDRRGKVCCPFHPDKTPSLHAYADPRRGWYCFGCRRGGSIYDLAAALWGEETHGAAFLRLRSRLQQHFDVRAAGRGADRSI